VAQSGGSTPRISDGSSGRIPIIDPNIFNVEDAVGGSCDRRRTNMIIKGCFKELQELREKIRSEFEVASIDDVGDIEIFDVENGSWTRLISFDLADRLSRRSIAKLRWYPPNIDKASSRAHKVLPAMCPPGDGQVFNFRPALSSSIADTGAVQHLPRTSPKLAPRPNPCSRLPHPPSLCLRALPRHALSPSPHITFSVRGGPLPASTAVVDASTARALAVPDVAPLLCENCDYTGLFVMESRGGSVNCMRLTFSIIFSGWFVPSSPQQSAVRISSGDAFHVSIQNLPFK
jgi:hypothetical protein